MGAAVPCNLKSGQLQAINGGVVGPQPAPRLLEAAEYRVLTQEDLDGWYDEWQRTCPSLSVLMSLRRNCLRLIWAVVRRLSYRVKSTVVNNVAGFRRNRNTVGLTHCRGICASLWNGRNTECDGRAGGDSKMGNSSDSGPSETSAQILEVIRRLNDAGKPPTRDRFKALTDARTHRRATASRFRGRVLRGSSPILTVLDAYGWTFDKGRV